MISSCDTILKLNDVEFQEPCQTKIANLFAALETWMMMMMMLMMMWTLLEHGNQAKFSMVAESNLKLNVDKSHWY
jgi:hypothetical protein